MNGTELYPDASRSLESLRQMRLLALLRDMIDDGGKVKAAKALGVNYRTVSKAVGSGTLTDRLANALERHLLLGGGSAAAQQWERVDALEKRLVGVGGGAARAASKPSSERSRLCGRSTPGRCGTWSVGWCGWKWEGTGP